MRIHVKLFAAVRERIGAEEIAVDLPEEAVAADVRQALGARYPDLDVLIARSVLAVDAGYAADDTPITNGSVVALIPPVSGG